MPQCKPFASSLVNEDMTLLSVVYICLKSRLSESLRPSYGYVNHRHAQFLLHLHPVHILAIPHSTPSNYLKAKFFARLCFSIFSSDYLFRLSNFWLQPSYLLPPKHLSAFSTNITACERTSIFSLPPPLFYSLTSWRK